MRLSFKTLIIFVLLFSLLINFTYFPHQILAQQATESAEMNSVINSKLKSLQDDIASKAAQLKEEISQKLQNKAYVGTVKQVTDETIIIETLSGEKTIKYNEFTETVGRNFTKPNLAQTGDSIAALGDVDENDVMTAKKIEKLSSISKKDIYFGSISAVNNKSISISQGDNILTFSFTKSSEIKSEKEDLVYTDLKADDAVAVIAQTEDNETFEVVTVYRFNIDGFKTDVLQSDVSEATSSTSEDVNL